MDSTNPTHKTSSSLHSLISQEDLFDPWRCIHGNEKDFTFYSSAHKVYSRLNLFLVDKFTLQRVSSTFIGLITWSDHALLSLEISISTNNTTPSPWRLNSFLLTKPEYQKQIDSALENFFAINYGSVSDPAILWNSHKAFIRGILIKISAQKKRQRLLSIT